MLGDTETKAAGGGEVLLLQLVLLHLQGAVKDLVGLEATNLLNIHEGRRITHHRDSGWPKLPTHSDVHGNLLVSADAESSDGVASCISRKR